MGKRGAALRALSMGVVAALWGHAALAAPSTKIGTAPLISPSAADAYYGVAAVHTNGTGEAGRPKEVVELARALKGDPDLIYEHVRNNMAPVWTYGLTKGAVGVIVDRSGTAFDQAHLMVELLRQSGWSAEYRLGTITLTGAQFQAWTGITSATAACQLLSSGGIPAAINGSTSADCSYGAATVASVELAHAWVAVTISGAAYVYDPAYKDHTFKAGLDLAAATGLTSGMATNVGATSGTASGVSFLVGYGQTTLNSALATATTNLETAVAASAPAGNLADVVGGRTINPQAIPPGGLRQASLPYTSNVLRTVAGDLPDQYRTKLRVQVTKVRPNATEPTIVDRTLYVDEVYGRRLTFEPNFDTSGASFTGALKLTDEFGAALTLASASYADNPTFSRGTATFTVDLPYAAGGGSYMDAVIAKPVAYALPFTVVHGWGDTGRGLIDKWGQRRDTAMPAVPDASCTACFVGYRAWKGDGRRETLAAAWLAQATRAAQLNAAIGKGIYAQHYAVGISSAETTVLQTANGGFWVTDSFDRLDVETGFSLTSTSANAAERRGAVLAAAASLAALKGSVSAQVSDLPDVNSAAARFAWGNAPTTGTDPAGGGSRRVYRYASNADAAQALGLTKTEAQTSTTATGLHSDSTIELGAAEVTGRRQAVADAVSAYVTAGFSVIASEEAFLGPGARGGGFAPVSSSSFTHAPSPQRGGAIAAVRYDSAGEPVETAFVVVNPNGVFDGGGGGAQTYHQAQYDPATSADVVKGRFVTGQPGAVSAVSPAQLVIGKAEFPFGLTGRLLWRDGEARDETYGRTHREPEAGWTTSFSNNLTISGSGLEAMGETDVRAATASIVAMYAAQDAYRSAPSLKRDLAGQLIAAWWNDKLVQNVASVTYGASTRQFVRKGSGGWFAPGAATGALVQTGTPAVASFHAGHGANTCSGTIGFVPTRGWSYAGVSFKVVAGAHGDEQTFSPWSNNVQGVGGAACGRQRGFRLTTWSWPGGTQLTFAYSRVGNADIERLASVTSNLGVYNQLLFKNGGLDGFRTPVLLPLREVTVAQAGSQVTHTDPAGNATRYDLLTLGLGDFARLRLQRTFTADNASLAAREYAYDTLGRVQASYDRLGLMGSRAPTQMFLADGLRAETLDPLGHGDIVYSDLAGAPVRTISAVGGVTTTAYDGRGRPILVTGPDGDRTQIEYNARNLPTKITRLARAGSAEVGQTLVTETGWDLTWDLPLWSTDAKGYKTEHWVSGGRITKTILPPSQPGRAFRLEEPRSYYPTGQLMSWGRAGGRTFSATYYGPVIDDLSDTAGNGSYDTEIFDAFGDPTQLKRPGGGRRNITYDLLRRPTLILEPQVGAAPRNGRRMTYDALGRVTKVERGTYAGTTFTSLETYSVEFDAVGNRIKEISPTSVLQTSYDALNRPICKAVRMNPEVFGSLPADACTPSKPGVHGPDRIVRATYDAAGRLIQSESGVGTDLQQVTVRHTYTPGGAVLTLTDASGNTSTLEYDGFGRPKRQRYPAQPRGAGVSSTTDYDEYGYDANGNVTSWRKRSGQVITYQYDQLNRLVMKDLPGTADDVYLEWADYNERQLNGRVGSPTSPAIWTRSYDPAWRLINDATGGGVTFDNEGRIATAGGGTGFATYGYDVAGRLATIDYQRSINGPGVRAATFSYGPLDRVVSVTRSNGVTSTYSYDEVGRVASIGHGAPSSTNAFVQTYGFNPAGQLVRQSQASDAYVWSGHPTTTSDYAHDALNRDAAMVAAAGYDTDGNLISDGVRTFTYDGENKLKSVTMGSSVVNLSYDPWGRLSKIVANGTTTTLAWRGAQLTREGPANIYGECCENIGDRVYVYSGGGDRPLMWDETAQPTLAPSFFHADRLGSVIATSSGGGTIAPFAYGPYGEPQSWSGSRFRYTGQIALPEAQLYHYKARVYDPILGRFLQTDPIGYGDGANIYAYVGGDPVNGIDPRGTDVVTYTGSVGFSGIAVLGGQLTYGVAVQIGDSVLTSDVGLVWTGALVADPKPTTDVGPMVEVDRSTETIRSQDGINGPTTCGSLFVITRCNDGSMNVGSPGVGVTVIEEVQISITLQDMYNLGMESINQLLPGDQFDQSIIPEITMVEYEGYAGNSFNGDSSSIAGVTVEAKKMTGIEKFLYDLKQIF